MNIEDIEAIPVEIPLSQPKKMARSTVHTARMVITRVTTDQGITGIGECPAAPYMSGDSVASVLYVVKEIIKPAILGMDCFNIESIFGIMERLIHGNYAAKCAVDIALYDAVGKALGVPVYQLMGGRFRDHLRVTWHLANADLEKDLKEAEEAMKQGYEILKLKVGTRDLSTDILRTRETAKALGEKVALRLDANQAWDIARAKIFVQAVDGCRLEFLEQPVAWWDLDGMAWIASSSALPITADEGIFTAEDAYQHVKRKAADILSVKLLKAGGLTGARRVAAVAAATATPLHLAAKIAETSVATAAAVHLGVALRNLEYDASTTSHYLADDVVQTPLQPKRGRIGPPDGHGLGVELDMEKIKAYRMDREGKFII